jgi:hypothetical protein
MIVLKGAGCAVGESESGSRRIEPRWLPEVFTALQDGRMLLDWVRSGLTLRQAGALVCPEYGFVHVQQVLELAWCDELGLLAPPREAPTLTLRDAMERAKGTLKRRPLGVRVEGGPGVDLLA